jgi:hypothetical protein
MLSKNQCILCMNTQCIRRYEFLNYVTILMGLFTDIGTWKDHQNWGVDMYLYRLILHQDDGYR